METQSTTNYEFGELDSVVLTHDIEEHGLKQGDIGAVVHCYKDGLAFEVEFVTADGNTIAVLTLNRDAIRPLESRYHVVYAWVE